MMKHKAILYIGNDLSRKSKYNSVMDTLCEKFTNEDILVYRSSSKMNKLLRLVEMVYSFFIYKNKVDYILIDTFSTTNFYYAYCISQLSRIFKKPYIPILHGGNLPDRLKNSKTKSDQIFKNAFVNISPSNYLNSIFNKHGYSSALIPNSIDSLAYNFLKREEIKPTLLYVRAFAEIYNPQMAIHVLKKIKKNYPSAKLCMIGPDKDGTLKQLKHLVEKYELVDAVEFTGVLKKEEWHKKSTEFDVFINTTNIDNTPVSIIEAMALGIPVVSTNVGGITYLIDDKVDGLLVNKNDANAMAAAVSELISGNYKSIPVSARTKAESFDWEHIKELWFSILK